MEKSDFTVRDKMALHRGGCQNRRERDITTKLCRKKYKNGVKEKGKDERLAGWEVPNEEGTVKREAISREGGSQDDVHEIKKEQFEGSS